MFLTGGMVVIAVGVGKQIHSSVQNRRRRALLQRLATAMATASTRG